MTKRENLDEIHYPLIRDAAMLFYYFTGQRLAAQKSAIRFQFAVDKDGKKQRLNDDDVDRFIKQFKYDYLSVSRTRMRFLSGMYEDRIYDTFKRRISKRKIRKCLDARRVLYQVYKAELT